ncbi:MAG: MFS transporter [Catenulispora sp.]|nr:MFS transporter [Catenulispora sp.]
MAGIFSHPGYARFWAADAVSTFGSCITTVAMSVLAVVTLHAGNLQVGLLNAARWTPYLLFGLLAGVIADRYRRRPILVATDLIRGGLLATIAILAATHLLTIYELAAFMAVFGALSLLYDASHQSYLPRLVPPAGLTAANARLQQTSALAQTTGPALGGTLVTVLGAPLGMALDAVSYIGSGLTLASIRRPEPAPQAADRDLRAELRAGLAFVYRHPVLRSAALTLHLRFFFASVISTVFTLFVLRDPGLGHDSKRAAFGLGVVLAVGGIGALLGNTLSGHLAHHSAGHLMTAERLAEPLAWTLAPLAVAGPTAWAMAAGAQFLVWLALGTSGPAEMAYRQSVTPDHLQGRANATIRSLNWGMFTLGAPLGGALATTYGYRTTLWLAISGMAATAVVAALSPMRTAQVAVTVSDT